MKKTLWFVLASLLVASGYSHAAGDNPQSSGSPLVKAVRAATAMYKDVRAAEAAGYVATACASGGMEGAMGIHYVNPGLLFNADGTPNGEFEVTTPEVLIYEPLSGGRLKLVGVEYIVFADAWNAAHADGASPVIHGQLFHYSGAPNRYRLPSFYELHVWAWKKNPSGTFADWNPHVSCDAYDPV